MNDFCRNVSWLDVSFDFFSYAKSGSVVVLVLIDPVSDMLQKITLCERLSNYFSLLSYLFPYRNDHVRVGTCP